MVCARLRAGLEQVDAAVLRVARDARLADHADRDPADDRRRRDREAVAAHAERAAGAVGGDRVGRVDAVARVGVRRARPGGRARARRRGRGAGAGRRVRAGDRDGGADVDGRVRARDRTAVDETERPARGEVGDDGLLVDRQARGVAVLVEAAPRAAVGAHVEPVHGHLLRQGPRLVRLAALHLPGRGDRPDVGRRVERARVRGRAAQGRILDRGRREQGRRDRARPAGLHAAVRVELVVEDGDRVVDPGLGEVVRARARPVGVRPGEVRGRVVGDRGAADREHGQQAERHDEREPALRRETTQSPVRGPTAEIIAQSLHRRL